MKRKLLLLSCIFIAAITLMYFIGNKEKDTNINETVKFDTMYSSIYDSDGKILEGKGTCYYSGYTIAQKDNKVSGGFKLFYGENSLWYLKAKTNGEIVLDYNCQINKGKFKVLLITGDKKINKLMESPAKGSITVKLQEGRNRIAMVGYGASGDIDMSIKFVKNVEIESKK